MDSPFLALCDPFGVGVPLNFDTINQSAEGVFSLKSLSPLVILSILKKTMLTVTIELKILSRLKIFPEMAPAGQDRMCMFCAQRSYWHQLHFGAIAGQADTALPSKSGVFSVWLIDIASCNLISYFEVPDVRPGNVRGHRVSGWGLQSLCQFRSFTATGTRFIKLVDDVI